MIKKQRDDNILRFIEQNNGISISQCANVFYHNHKFAYNEARRRLKILEDNQYLNHFKMPNTGEYVYCMGKSKNISYHNFMILNVYAKLINLNFNILTFQKELIFSTGKRCDAYFELEYNNQFIPIILEIDFSHKTDIYKYDDIYESNELQNKYLNKYGTEYTSIFPKIIIVTYHSNNQYNYNGLLDYEIINFNLSNLFTKVLFNTEQLENI